MVLLLLITSKHLGTRTGRRRGLARHTVQSMGDAAQILARVCCIVEKKKRRSLEERWVGGRSTWKGFGKSEKIAPATMEVRQAILDLGKAAQRLCSSSYRG